MWIRRMSRVLRVCAIAAGLAGFPLLCTFGAAAQIAPPPFLPWPPAIPDPAGPAWPGSAPSGGAIGPAAAIALGDVIAVVQAGVDKLRQFMESLRETAAAALAQIVLPLPIGVPGPVAPADVLTQLAGLPDAWRSIIAGALAKLRPLDLADAAQTRRRRDIAGSPQLSHEAVTIAAADQQLIAGAAQQEIAAASTQALASAAAGDTSLPLAVAAAQSAADMLASGARDLPSSRAGIELLVAGAGAGLRDQAALTTALADRLVGLMQQSAQLSSQIGGLASATGLFTERALERDRDALDARLGLADAARGGTDFLRQLLLGAGEPADEIRIGPLY
ncbi:MAG TPA: hypothetical protein VFL28_15640 [bacterium]|nr:hypothetical protein [bacterium]